MRIVSMFMILLLMAPLAFAGKITGKVTDEKTGEPIIGAIIAVKNTEKGSVSDVDGNYFIDIADGTYVLEIKYVGYTTKEVDNVVVKGEEPTMANVTIKEAGNSQTLEEVVVRSSLKKENISALYTMQKNAIAVSSGISADIIQKSPDKNTGEVLKRVSGASIQNNKFVVIRGLNDRYNLAMVNNALMPSTEPDRKAFSFDIIPSNLIDNIIITKTASPDLPGDVAGGVVQVLTKDVPDQGFFNASVNLGYNTQSTFQNFTAPANTTTGNRLGFYNVNDKLPSAFGDSYKYYKSSSLTNADRLEIAKTLPNSYGDATKSALPNMALQLSGGKTFHMNNGGKVGTILGLSYRSSYTTRPELIRGTYTADNQVNSRSVERAHLYNSSLAAIANFSYVKNNTKISFKNLFNTIHDNTYYVREGYSVSSSQQSTLRSSVPLDRYIYSAQLEGDHGIGKTVKFNWNLNYSTLNAKQYDLRTSFYSRGITNVTNNSTQYELAGDPYRIIPRNSRRFFSDLKDNNIGGNFYFNIPYTLFGEKQALKFGYLGLYKTRDFDSRTFQYDLIQPDLSLETQAYDQIFNTANLSETKFELEEITNPPDAYKANSTLHAGYVMSDNHMDKWRLTWGVRLESYTQHIDAYDFSRKIDKTDVFTDVLPSINISYDLSEKSKFRLSASQTVNRPEFRELAPFQFIDFENNWTIIGNENLVRSNITNADLRYEYYPEPGSAITVGAFYKYFKKPIENVMNPQSNLDLLIFGFQNAPSATAYGAELDVRKNLSFISSAPIWERFVVAANLTLVKSEVSLDSATFGVTKNRPLQGQSPYLVNASILYADPKTGLSLSGLYNRVGHRIYIVGTRDIPTTWENGRNVVDLQISKLLLKKRAELKLTIGDIFNQQTVFYWNTNDKNSYQAGPSIEGIGNDQIFKSYRDGTTFTLGFSYKF